MIEYYSNVCMCRVVDISIHLLMNMGCFRTLAIVNNIAVNIGVHVSVLISVSVFFRYIPMSGLTGSYVSSTFSF